MSRILFVTTSFENGAIPNILLDLAPIWRSEGWDCVFLALETLPEQHASVRRCRSLGFTLLSLGVSSRSVMTALLRLRKAIRELRPDIISTHLGRADIFTPWVKGRVPQVTTHHSVKRNAGRLTLLGYKLSDSRIIHRTGVSQACNDSFLADGFLKSPHVVIPNPVSLDRLTPRLSREEFRSRLGWSDGDQVLAVVGRLIPAKDHTTLIRAIAELRSRFSGVKLVIAGDGPLRETLESQVREARLADSVHFLGAVENVADVYAMADGVVLSSLWEGLGLVILEAWASGCPVAASSIPAIREFVVDGENGILFEAGQLNSMVGALAALLEDPVRARRQAERGRLLVRERFSPLVIAQSYSRLFRQILDGTLP